MSKSFLVRAITLSATFAALALSNANAETVKIVVAAPAPPGVPAVKVFRDKLIPYVNERIAAAGKDFKIEWVGAYGSSLAKPTETLEAVEENIAQMAILLKNFEEAKLPLEQYPLVAPFTVDSEEQISAIDNNMRKKLPALNEAYRKHGQEFIVSGSSPTYDLFTKFPMRSIDDLKGRKIGVSGSLGEFFRGTGVVTVNSGMPDSFTSIRSGVYEGYPISIPLAFTYRTYEAAPYYTELNFGATLQTAITVNSDVWKKFPEYVREIIRDAGTKWVDWQIEEYREENSKAIEAMKKSGVNFSVFSPEERKRWAMTMPNVAKEWAERQEAKGFPGRAVMAAYFAELRALNVKMLREWDKE